MSERFASRGLVRLVLAVAVLVGLWAVYAIVSGHDNGAGDPEPARDPYKHLVWHDNPVPAPRQSFTGPEAQAMTLADLKGKAVLLNLWASWCVPCIQEMPALSRLERDLGGAEFMVVTVSLDRVAGDGKSWLARNGLANLGFHHDPGGKLYDALKAPGLPLSVFIDKAGREVGRVAGEVPWDEPRARALIARAGGPALKP